MKLYVGFASAFEIAITLGIKWIFAMMFCLGNPVVLSRK